MHVHIAPLSKYNSRVWSLYLYFSLYAQFVLSVLPTLSLSTSSPFSYMRRAVSRGTQYLTLFMFILTAMRKTASLHDYYERDRQSRPACSRWAALDLAVCNHPLNTRLLAQCIALIPAASLCPPFSQMTIHNTRVSTPLVGGRLCFCTCTPVY